MTREARGWVAVRHWLPPAWDRVFFAKCLALRLAVTVGPPWLLISAGQGVFALIAFIALSWPWPRRLRVSEAGLRFRYAFIDGTLSAADLEGASVEADPRCWVLGRRAPLLLVRRRAGAPLMIFAPLATLQGLLEELRSQGR